MENKMKKRINTIGKIGRILSMILIVLVILASIATLVGTVVAAQLPSENINVVADGTVDISSDGDLFTKLKEQLEVAQKDNSAQLKVAGEDVLIADDDDILENAKLSETDDGYKIDFNSKKVSLGLNRIVYALISTLVYLICVVVTLFMLRKLMKSLEKCDSPFNDLTVKGMKMFGYSLIPFVVLRSIVESAWGSITSLDLNVGLNIDLTMVFVVLVIFALSMIFTYGAELQRQSDETL